MKYLWALIAMLVGLAMAGHFKFDPLVSLVIGFGLPALIIWKGRKP